MQMVPNDKKNISHIIRIFIIFTEIKNSIKHFGIIKELLRIYVRHKRSIFFVHGEYFTVDGNAKCAIKNSR